MKTSMQKIKIKNNMKDFNAKRTLHAKTQLKNRSYYIDA